MLLLLSLLSCRPADPPPLNVVLVVIDGIRDWGTTTTAPAHVGLMAGHRTH